MSHFSDGMSAPRWTDGLSRERLATVAHKNHALGIGGPPPDPVAVQVAAIKNRARAAKEAAWIEAMNQWSESQREAMQPYVEQVQAQNARTEAEQKQADDAKRREQAAADEEREERRQPGNHLAMTLAGETNARLVTIRAEIASILEAT
jgi:hypothetical protein